MDGEKGLTLLELLVVVFVLGVLATVAAPSLQALNERSQARALHNQLHATLYLSRTIAITEHVPVVICHSAEGTRCSESADGWSHGWIAFTSPSNVNDCVLDEAGDYCTHGGRLLSVKNRPIQSGSIYLRNNQNVRQHIKYNPIGATPGYTGRITVCSRQGAGLSGLVIPQTGRIRSATEAEFLPC